ncbi:MAG: cytochrome P460 family protein [Saprospiraceae bacterium]|nr:cytochrome P460 family protein [Saprospiraceae bacterium]
MKKTTFAFLFMSSFAVLSVFQACKDDEDPITEFIAEDATFSGFGSFHLHTTKQGADPALGPAHAGNDATAKREIYFKDDVSPANGKYPVGAVVVKHTTNGDGSVNEVTAMVKRGNNFDAAGGDWEYFMLQPDGKIAKDPDGNLMRGAKLMNGMCQGCHSGAAAKDYIFTK